MRDDIDFRPHHEKHEPEKQNSEPSFEAKGYALHKASSHARRPYRSGVPVAVGIELYWPLPALPEGSVYISEGKFVLMCNARLSKIILLRTICYCRS